MIRFLSFIIATAICTAPLLTPAMAAVNYNSSKSNSGNKLATPSPKPAKKPTPKPHMAVKGSGVPTCANGIRYISSTGAVICNGSAVANPKLKATHPPGTPAPK
jgi:hypothetical protein